MSKRKPYEIPVGLKEAEERFAQWRSSQSGRRPIPEALWQLAAELAGQHGIFRTAQVLRLDYTRLKQRTRTVAPGRKRRTASPTFVELMAPATAQKCECVIEVEGPHGRIRIEWKGSAVPDLAGLSRMLWEPGA
jgi:hypothetical protein